MLGRPGAAVRWIVTLHLGVFCSLVVVGALGYSAESRTKDFKAIVAQAPPVLGKDSHEDIAGSGFTSTVDHYRLTQLEEQVRLAHLDLKSQIEKASAERAWVDGLLIANLCALVASLLTFILTRRTGA